MVERMTLIMDAFPGNFTRLTLESVARRTRLPRSTAHRILDQLVQLRWLEHTSAGYGLGRRALNLGGRDGSHGEIREAAAPLLHDLQITTGMTVHLAVLDGGDVYYLDKIGGRSATSVPSKVGGRAPAHSTALGKALLALLEPEQVDDRIGELISRRTTRTIGELNVLHQELNRIRQRHGLAFEREECFPEISCVAAAIRGHAGPVASISLAGNARTPLERVAPLVSNAAREASTALAPESATARRNQATETLPEQTWSATTMDRFLATSQYEDWM